MLRLPTYPRLRRLKARDEARAKAREEELSAKRSAAAIETDAAGASTASGGAVADFDPLAAFFNEVGHACARQDYFGCRLVEL